MVHMSVGAALVPSSSIDACGSTFPQTDAPLPSKAIGLLSAFVAMMVLAVTVTLLWGLWVCGVCYSEDFARMIRSDVSGTRHCASRADGCCGGTPSQFITSIMQLLLILGISTRWGIPDLLFATGDEGADNLVLALQFLPLTRM